MPYVIGLALLCWVFAAISMIRTARKKESRILGVPRTTPRGFILGGVLFAATIGSTIFAGALIARGATQELWPLLSSRVDSVTVNGVALKQTDPIVSALRDMFGFNMGHHSHPTRCFHVVLQTEQGPLALDPCRDSSDPHEYWVFYPNFRYTRMNPVGHAFTDALDGM
jgi:hypothetical protein